MSKLGYIKESYGKSFTSAIANTYSFNVLGSAEGLPRNTFIVASNIDENGYDTGTYSLLITDPYGNPVRLTYTLQEGNGFYYSSELDGIKLSLDKDTLIYSLDEGITLNIQNHLSDIFSIDGNNIYINEDKLPISDANTLGIGAVDNNTIISDNGFIYVNTSGLKYANNSTNQYGIAIGDGDTINVDNGKISLNISSLHLASDTEYGLSKGDEHTIHSTNGTLSVVTENLDKAVSDKYGISKADGETVIVNDDKTITVNESNLTKATSDTYGLSMIDSATLEVKENNVVSVKQYDNIISSIATYKDIYNKYKIKLQDYIDYLSSGNILLKNKNVILFAVNETSTIELDKPTENEEVINMPLQTVTAVFNDITTCYFILNIDFEEGTNEFQKVDKLELNYNDEITYSKVEALDPKTVYSSTKGELKKLIIKFSAKNFRNTVRNLYIVTSINLVLSSAEDHNKQLTQKYSILRYNSLYREEQTLGYAEEFYVLIEDSVMWDFSIINENNE